jgi:ParB family transcriptional regulator, chromosome partitioning protein
MLTIEYINITELKPSPKNARLHSQEHVEQLIASIREFGFTNPILIDEDNNVIAGHGRLEAMKRTFHDSIACVRLLGLTDQQKQAYMLADNKLALNSEWDITKLQEAINELDAEGFDLTIAGFIEDDIRKLTEELETAIEKDIKNTSKEIDIDSFNMAHECPKCGFEFND